jgi:class 3 adenylate cyclase
MTAVRPSGVMTFLFTDVEGSTRRWEAYGDAMRAALLAHDDVLRTAIDARGGCLFKHTGDGVREHRRFTSVLVCRFLPAPLTRPIQTLQRHLLRRSTLCPACAFGPA